MTLNDSLKALSAEFLSSDFPGYAVGVAGGREYSGIFKKAYVETNRIAGTRPLFQIVETDQLSEGDVITIESRAYTIRVIENDGAGMALLILEE